MAAHAAAVRKQPSPFERSRERFESLVGKLESSETLAMSHADLERLIDVEGRQILLQLMQDHIDLRSPGEVSGPVVGADGVERRHARPHQRKLETRFGGVMIGRAGYGMPGVVSLHPLDTELNLPCEVYSLEVRRCVALQAAQRSFEATCATVSGYTGAHVPKRQAEELAKRAAVDFEAFYGQRQRAAAVGKKAAELLVLSFDGKGVRMLKRALRELTRQRGEQHQPKLKWRRSKGEKSGQKRMAEVAAVYTVAPFVRTPEEVIRELTRTETAGDRPPRPRPQDKRVWASLEREAHEVIAEVFVEAQRRDPEHAKTWVVLVDGNESQLYQAMLAEGRIGHTIVIIVDLFHVAQRLWTASYAFAREGTPEAEAWVHERLLRILEGKAVHVAAGMRRSATLQRLSATQRKSVDDCADYLLKYAPFLAYDEYLAQGLPIASGVIEGTCRHLINDRMDLTGARWGLATSEAVLKLRALWASGDFDDYWLFHERCEFERNHASAYCGTPPTPIKPTPRRSSERRHLRVVR
jgi:hypothetical protein